jgi:hypothetical protein
MALQLPPRQQPVEHVENLGQSINLNAYLCQPLLYCSTYIHPDTLQLLFGLFAVKIAVKHAKNGDNISLIAVGLLCGIIQGTKVGGPWTVPLAGAALLMGISAGQTFAGWLKSVLSRGGLLTLSAFVGFILSTTYVILASYYFDSMKAALNVVTNDMFSQTKKISVFTWFTELRTSLGPTAFILLLLALARAFINGVRRTDPMLVLGTVLAVSQFLWFASTGKLWHVLGYLILAIGIMAVFAFETVMKAIDWLSNRSILKEKISARSKAIIGFATCALIALPVLNGTITRVFNQLGGVDKVPDPKSCGGDEDEAEVAFRGFVVAGRQPSAVLEL